VVTIVSLVVLSTRNPLLTRYKLLLGCFGWLIAGSSVGWLQIGLYGRITVHNSIYLLLFKIELVLVEVLIVLLLLLVYQTAIVPCGLAGSSIGICRVCTYKNFNHKS
jgi:hypothetical protein